MFTFGSGFCGTPSRFGNRNPRVLNFEPCTDRGLYDRCIIRGPLGSIQPGNAYEFVQAPGYVAIRREMIHEARVVSLNNRPHVAARIRSYMGDSRGHWEGNTLVVVTKNLNGLGILGGNVPTRASERLIVTERFTMLEANTLQFSATVDDSGTWTRPWTISRASERSPSPTPKP